MRYLFALLLVSCIAHAQSSPSLRIQDNGTVKPLRYKLNLIGATVADDPTNGRTNVTLSGLSSLSGALNIGIAQTVGLNMSNTTASTSGHQQFSSMLVLGGTGFQTGTSASQTVENAFQTMPVQGSTFPTGALRIWQRIAGGSWAEALTISNDDGAGVTSRIGQGIMGIRFYPGGATIDIMNNSSQLYTFGTNYIQSYWSADLRGFNNLAGKTLTIGSTSAKPTCDSSIPGQVYYFKGGAGVTDTLSVCMKSAADAYAWHDVVTGG